ncbi:MAG: proton-conducting transporter membrane subunit, partial [Pseudomonadota bacterium]
FHHIPAMMGLILLGGLIGRECGSERLERLGGLWTAGPWLGILFLIPMLSLIGVPPLSGFWAKFFMIRASFESGDYLFGALILMASVLTFFYLGRVFVSAFWQPRPGVEESAIPACYPHRLLVLPVMLLAAVTLGISLWPDNFFALADSAAGSLLDPTPYLRTVLGGP